jgi:tetratricopeptide (TPR) repeat protein
MKHLSTQVVAALTLSLAGFVGTSLRDLAMGQTAIQGCAPGMQANVDALQTQALQEAQDGKLDDSIRDYKCVLTLRPDWKEGWWNLGTLQYSANKFAEAESTFTNVVKFAPSMGVAWSLLGLSEFETKNFSNSEAHLEKAQLLGIDDDEIKRVSTYHLGMLLVRSGQFKQAQDLLLKSFGGEVITPQLKYVLGLALLRVPLLPTEIDPSQEALVTAAGDVAAGDDAISLFPAFVYAHGDVPYVHYSYGIALDKAGRLKEALAQMREEASVSPQSPLPWTEISRLEGLLGDAKESRAAAAKVTALSTKTSIREERMIKRYSNVAVDASLKGRPSKGLDPGDRGMQEYAAGQYSAANADLKASLSMHPNNGTGWAVLGLSEFKMQDYGSALIHLERGRALGLKGSPESVRTATYTLGILLIHAGDFDRATDLLASALKMIPKDEEIEYALGLALLRRQEFPGQETQQHQLISGAGKIAALLQESRYDEAFPMFKSLLQQFPAEPFLHYTYGTALLALSEFEEAAAQMNAEIAISPKTELPYVSLASIKVREHKAAEAIPFAQRALTLSPQSAEAHYLLGRASLETGDDATAVRELEVAAKLSPGSPEVHFNLAKAYTRAQRTEEATRERATFARLNELAQVEKSQKGNQIYTGPHDTNMVNQPTAPEIVVPHNP